MTNAARFYRETLGMRGFVAGTCNYLFGWPKEIRVIPPGIRKAVSLRLRTSDVLVYNFVLLAEEYRLAKSDFEPQVIVDAGANIGLTAIYYANKYPNSRIIAVEPEASNYRMMLKNIAPYPNITPIQVALWKLDGEVSLTNEDDREKWTFSVKEAGGTTRAVRLPTLLAEFGLHKIDLLKVDIEGAEKEVFESCDWITCIGAIVIETHDRLKPGCEEAVDNVTTEFDKQSRGELTFYFRPALSGERANSQVNYQGDNLELKAAV